MKMSSLSVVNNNLNGYLETSSNNINKTTAERVQDVKTKYPGLFAKVVLNEEDEMSLDIFYHVITVLFDINNDRIVYHASNLDLLWRPTYDESLGDNYFTYLISENDDREPVPSMLSYLFKDTDEEYGEPYEFTEEEVQLRKDFYQYLCDNYKSGQDYIDRVSALLSLNNKSFNDNWGNIIQNKVFAPQILLSERSPLQ
jgi:hypothetical protein